MAITIDQFLRDLTERELLSTEEAHTVRRQLTANVPELAASMSNSDEGDAGVDSDEHPTRVAKSASLVLCDCLIQDKLHDDEHHLVFNAQRLRDDSAVTIHVLMSGTADSAPGLSRLNGTAFNAGELPARPKGITDVDRHGDMMFVCCESLEAETLEQVVLQNGVLPLELATETLLQTARTLKRLEEQGFSLQLATPQTLLLDEDGHVHLTGSAPDQFLKNRSAPPQNQNAPRNRLFESLGQLYVFLLSGRPADVSGAVDFASLLPAAKDDRSLIMTQAAKQVYARLTGRSAYENWNGLIQDLERLLNGQESPESCDGEVSRRDRPQPETAALASTTTATEDHPAVSSAVPPATKPPNRSGQWMMIAVALLVALILAAIFMLGD